VGVLDQQHTPVEQGRVWAQRSWAGPQQLKGSSTLAPPGAELRCPPSQTEGHIGAESPAPGLQVRFASSAPVPLKRLPGPAGWAAASWSPPAQAGAHSELRLDQGQSAPSSGRCTGGAGLRRGPQRSGCCHPSAGAGWSADRWSSPICAGRSGPNSIGPDPGSAFTIASSWKPSWPQAEHFQVQVILRGTENVQIGHRWRGGLGAYRPIKARRPRRQSSDGLSRARWAVAVQQPPPVTPEGVRRDSDAGRRCQLKPPPGGNGAGQGLRRSGGPAPGQLPRPA